MAQLSIEAQTALRERLAKSKDRDDVEILGVLGVRVDHVSEWYGSTTGLVFTVEFTYTGGRPRRREADLGFNPLPGPDVRGGSVNPLPDSLGEFLTAAVRTTTTEGEPK